MNLCYRAAHPGKKLEIAAFCHPTFRVKGLKHQALAVTRFIIISVDYYENSKFIYYLNSF